MQRHDSFRFVFATAFLLTALTACGDDAASTGDGGPSSGDGGAQSGKDGGGTGADAGDGGGTPVGSGDGGMSVADGGGDDAGGGVCDYPTESEFHFGVTVGSTGIAKTEVRAQSDDNEHSADLFSSAGKGAHKPGAAGKNTLAIDEADLGLKKDDELDAISFGPFVPEPRIVHFSLRKADGIAGKPGSAVRKQMEDEFVPGDTYTSKPFADDDSDDNTNELEFDEVKVGLEPHDDNAGTPVDDLDVLDFSAVPADGPIYLSLKRDGAGKNGATVRVWRDGAIEALLSAKDLGLKDTDELDALVVLDADGDGDFGKGDSVLFSVSNDSEGRAGTAVERQSRLGEVAGDIFVSTGDGKNQVYLDEGELGLLNDDDLDALEVTSEAPDCGCGDGKLDAGEECEAGIACANAADICLPASCKCATDEFCGDGVLTWPEQCETSLDCPGFPWFPVACGAGCRCHVNKSCGDGNLDAGEACDLGVLGGGVPCPNPGDVCTPGCQCDSSSYCGDGVLEPFGESCDPGAPGFFGGFMGPNVPCSDATKTCTNDCRCIKGPPAGYCGDLVMQGFEECEHDTPCTDPNDYCDPFECDCISDGDACNVNGVRGPREACDPLAEPNGCLNGEACNEDCACVEADDCGDGVLSPNEECDLVWGGNGQQIPFGCDTGDTCNPATCECETCGHANKSVQVISIGGGIAPTCGLIHGGIDACSEGHWHQGAIVLDTTTCAMKFKPDPAPTVCGHGKDSDIPEHAVNIPGKCMCDLARSVPCADL